MLRSQAAVPLGYISYSLYLARFIVMSALAKIIGRFAMEQDARAELLMAATLGVLWRLAALSYAYVEKPGMLVSRKLLAAMRPGSPINERRRKPGSDQARYRRPRLPAADSAIASD